MPTRSGASTATAVTLIPRPSPLAHAIDRPAVRSKLNHLVESRRVVVVIAPAGFGKTSALNSWAGASSRLVAWLSLTTSDRYPEHLAQRISAALEELRLTPDEPGVEGTDERDRESVDEDISVLIIDDVHLAASAESRAILIQLLERAPRRLHIVLAGRHSPPFGLTRFLANGELDRLSLDDLAFSAEEVELAAAVMGQPLTSARAAELHALTKGWPVAVRLALMTSPRFESNLPAALRLAAGADIPQLVDYLVENVIDQLPASLRAFVPRACTCDWLTGRMASELAGNSRGAELLERALALGLPLERRGTWRGEPVYRWHPVMAQAGRAILLRRDPELALGLHRAVARFLTTIDPTEAARHSLRGHDPDFAAQLIRSSWLVPLMNGESDVIEELCAQLPARWAEDPQILVIRAVCRRNGDDPQAAAELSLRASLAAESLDPEEQQSLELTGLLARLFLADDEQEIAAASAAARVALTRDSRVGGDLRACGTLLIGWIELRLRHMHVAAQLLREAAQLCQAEGLDTLAERARANHIHALAFAGDFVGASARLAAAGSDEKASRWRLTDGGIEAYTRGFIRFWQGDHDGALVAFRQAVEKIGSPTSFSQLARLGLVQAALDQGDRLEIARAAAMLDDLPRATVQGMPWGLWHAISQAGVLVSRGDSEAAVRVLDTNCADAPFAPNMMALTAELYWKCDRPGQARAQAELFSADFPAYLRTSGLVVTALCDRLAGSTDTAHALLEEALELGASLGLARAFHLRDRRLEDLLAEHATRGSRHEAFLATQIAYHRSRAQELGDNTLSARESEILGYLATTLTAAEICGLLFISSNTLKSHLRSIYRKLGVDNRRDAVRIA
ncbi:MAG: LuxR C-terminal-related transcriptional regulator [Propionicimonas sp.]